MGQLTGHSDLVNAIALSPNGQFLVSGSEDKTVKIWSLTIS
jgi:WD40 repeat protein